MRAHIEKKLKSFTLQLDLSFGQGITVLTGPSGAGKTTLLNCIAGLQKPDRGLIEGDGNILFSSDRKINLPPQLRRLGYVFQDYALFPHMTVKKNVLYGVPKGCKCSHGYQLSVIEVLDMLKITHLQDRYPQELSGGEKQRVALARALMVEPKMLLLDEPLSALDEKTRRDLRQELKKLNRRWEIPFLLVTHSLEEAHYLGDAVIRMEQGQKSPFASGKTKFPSCQKNIAIV